ncbi:MAG TPA: hypothetical protein VMU29_08860 [Smithella sp.]|nr:hypothetical protein [Smithella sp.]
MKKGKQWQKPEAGVMKQNNIKKAAGSLRNVEVRYSLGIGPVPVPPSTPELV